MLRFCLVNVSDRYYIIYKGVVVGEVVEVNLVDLLVEKKFVINLFKILDYLYLLLYKLDINLILILEIL